jgi:DNA-binding CsgD family transcriptional regulator
MDSNQSSLREAIERLAPRELDCLRGVAQHKRSAQIAHELSLKPKTVDTYIATASRKLGVSDRGSAARMLLEYERSVSGKSPSASSGVEPAPARDPTSFLSRLPWPFPTKGRPSNDLTILQLLVAIGVAAALMMAVAAIYLSAIALLSDVLPPATR